MVALEFLPHEPGAFTRHGHLIAQVWKFKDFLDFAQPIRPWAISAAGERSCLGEVILIQGAIKVSKPGTGRFIAASTASLASSRI